MGGTLGSLENQMLMGGSANPYGRATQLAAQHGGAGNAQLFGQQTAIGQADYRQAQLGHLISLLSQAGQMAGYFGGAQHPQFGMGQGYASQQPMQGAAPGLNYLPNYGDSLNRLQGQNPFFLPGGSSPAWPGSGSGYGGGGPQRF